MARKPKREARPARAEKPRGVWSIRLIVPASQTDLRLAVESHLESISSALSSFEAAGGKTWSIEALCETRPNRGEVLVELRGLGAPVASFDYLPPKDWVSESQRLHAPIRAGRFFIHGSHFAGKPPRGSQPILLDAGMAFGTGRHETTKGCLLALDRLRREGRKVRRPLDLGCGSGILAMAMARLWGVPVLAADTDKPSVAVARQNADINGVGPLVRTLRSHGFQAAALRLGGPYGLIAANILAKPLCRLAPGFARHLAPDGRLLLSGLMVDQEAEVVAAQERAGLKLLEARRLGDWSTLLLTTGGRKPKRKPTKAKRRPPSGSRRRSA
jgi:ribosomal protein L11 methyltransferase